MQTHQHQHALIAMVHGNRADLWQGFAQFHFAHLRRLEARGRRLAGGIGDALLPQHLRQPPTQKATEGSKKADHNCHCPSQPVDVTAQKGTNALQNTAGQGLCGIRSLRRERITGTDKA